MDIVGGANKTATVTVNGTGTDYRRGEYWHKYVSVNNSVNPVWLNVNVTTTGGGSASGNVFVPQTPEGFDHDLDGNLLYDGRWEYTWDAENRLIRLVTRTTMGPPQRIEFEYDWRGRRIGKKVWSNRDGTGDPALTRKFLYDQWNLVAELDNNNAVVRSYVWGTDLSGTLQGAGGVGGLLMVQDAAQVTHFAAYDLNGNVMGLVKATDDIGTWSAQYEYGPFGEVIRATGPMAKANPFRFSTKYQDEETDLVYYGYRYYNPILGRWPSRDPIEEPGLSLQHMHTGKASHTSNPYLFAGNAALDHFDPLGLDWHHLLPKAIFNDALLTQWGIKIDINSAEYGWNIDPQYHTRKGGLHPSAWNQAWRDWVDKMKASGKPVTKCDIDIQLAKMKQQFKPLLDLGKPATTRYNSKSSINIRGGGGPLAVMLLAMTLASNATADHATEADDLLENLEAFVAHANNGGLQQLDAAMVGDSVRNLTGNDSLGTWAALQIEEAQ